MIKIFKKIEGLNSYILGFSISVVLTLVSFYVVFQHIGANGAKVSNQIVAALIMLIAILQLIVQLIFFLHLGRESKPKWNLIALFATISTILIIIVASIWIINNLNYNMMPQNYDSYILIEEGITK